MCLSNSHVTSQHYIHATIQRQIPGSFKIWHMPQSMATQQRTSGGQ